MLSQWELERNRKILEALEVQRKKNKDPAVAREFFMQLGCWHEDGTLKEEWAGEPFPGAPLEGRTMNKQMKYVLLHKDDAPLISVIKILAYVAILMTPIIVWGLHLRSADREWCASRGLMGVEQSRTLRLLCVDEKGRLYRPTLS